MFLRELNQQREMRGLSLMFLSDVSNMYAQKQARTLIQNETFQINTSNACFEQDVFEETFEENKDLTLKLVTVFNRWLRKSYDQKRYFPKFALPLNRYMGIGCATGNYNKTQSRLVLVVDFHSKNTNLHNLASFSAIPSDFKYGYCKNAHN